MTYEEIKEKYSHDKSGYICCFDCPLCIKNENNRPIGCFKHNSSCDGHEMAYARIQEYLSDKENLSDKKNTVALYVDWENKEFISEEEYNEMTDISNEGFLKWLNVNYSASDVYDMDGIDRQDVYNKYCEKIKESSAKIRSDYERVEVEL